MHLVIQPRACRGFAALLAFAVLALGGTPAVAQPGGPSGPPGIDHYLVYRTSFVPGSFQVILRDQFLPHTTHQADPLQYFANPVSKNGEGVVDTALHYSWWRLNPPRQFTGTVIASNQFGDQQLNLTSAGHLLNPALKNVPSPQVPLPVANHYLCYGASGPFVPRTVTLQDQFGAYEATVIAPELFCTPVEKTYGATDPIVRPEAHLVCYRIQPLSPFPATFITFFDQFRFGPTNLLEQIWLCVPTIKHEVTGADGAAWGSVKAIYR